MHLGATLISIIALSSLVAGCGPTVHDEREAMAPRDMQRLANADLCESYAANTSTGVKSPNLEREIQRRRADCSDAMDRWWGDCKQMTISSFRGDSRYNNVFHFDVRNSSSKDRKFNVVRGAMVSNEFSVPARTSQTFSVQMDPQYMTTGQVLSAVRGLDTAPRLSNCRPIQ